MPTSDTWPDLSRLDLQPTMEALHLWSQIAGKVRLMLTPWVNHSWHVTLYVSVRGFTTGPIPVGARAITLEFDFLADALTLCDSDGRARRVALQPQSVASFYAKTMQALDELDVAVRIDALPCEIPAALPFDADMAMRAYDGEVARAWWRTLVQVERVFHLFRTRFVGKCSPIHLFWGSFDLAVTRFSGRPAPRHPGGGDRLPDAVARDAYSPEVSSAGFWPGGGAVKGHCFYSYAYPSPAGFATTPVEPAAARFDTELGEFLLPYEAVRASANPDETLLAFLQSTYEAAANCAQWNRTFLEGPTGPLGCPPDGA